MVATRARQGSDPRPGGIADEIDEALIEAFAQARRGEVSVATTNRGLAVLRRMLRLDTNGVLSSGSLGSTCCVASAIGSSF